MPSRHEQVVAVAARQARAVANDVLAERVSGHFSQADWEGFATEIAENLAHRLVEHLPLKDLVEAGELRKIDGSLNGDGVYDALIQLRDGLKGRPAHAQVAYLAQHLHKTLTGLRLMAPRRHSESRKDHGDE